MTLIDMFEKNPKAGIFGTIATFITGSIPSGFNPDTRDSVIFIFQVLAFAVSITVGVFTVIGMCRKWRRENREEKLSKQQSNNDKK